MIENFEAHKGVKTTPMGSQQKAADAFLEGLRVPVETRRAGMTEEIGANFLVSC